MQKDLTAEFALTTLVTPLNVPSQDGRYLPATCLVCNESLIYLVTTQYS